jgi:hypothetical protein
MELDGVASACPPIKLIPDGAIQVYNVAEGTRSGTCEEGVKPKLLPLQLVRVVA